MLSYPTLIPGGDYPEGHVQGIALDEKKGFVYYSFTTALVKTDLQGNLIGSVIGLTGHLGCIDFNPEDGRVYGSLEYKNDAIGQGIFRRIGREGAPAQNCFYIAIFDADGICAENMDAKELMRTVYLPDVAADFEGTGEQGLAHRYACSGCDGLAFGPVFGAAAQSPRMLMLAYGIYGDTARTDNDNQIILQYDWRSFAQYAKPLTQDAPHQSGPAADARYFAFTGNTSWGVQNLCYDAETRRWLLFVYRGKKEQYPNYGLYLFDGTKAPKNAPVAGLNGEMGLHLTPCEEGELHAPSGVRGFGMDLGQYGVHALSKGYFYIAHPYSTGTPQKRQGARIRLYRYTGLSPTGFERVE